ncbi:ParA family protein [Kocuria sp. JC486]|uniref:AAA family ATPase n=1 Tax=Kocuria sp. JC486 TaxID=1970736 RepID=UPI001421C36E|nr:ParA family protein [Kocuria sp. JC486]
MQIVSISSLKGGVGKSSVALGLASAALDNGLRTLVVDLDPHADATTGLGVHAPSRSTVGRVLAKRGKAGALGGITVASPWPEVENSPAWSRGNLDVAPGSSQSSHFDRATYKGSELDRLSRALTGLESRYDLVLVDCPPNLNALTRMAWAASDKVLSVAEPSLFSVAGTQRTMTAIAQFERGSRWAVDSAGVVINKVDMDSSEHQHRVRELNELFGHLVVDPVIPEHPVWQRAQGAAWPIHRWPGDDALDMAQRFSTIVRGLVNSAK